MAKVQILLPKPILVHLSKDDKVELPAGIQEIDEELAKHWYVAAHSQPITSHDLEVDSVKKDLEAATTALSEKDAEIEALKAQLEAATTAAAKAK